MILNYYGRSDTGGLKLWSIFLNVDEGSGKTPFKYVEKVSLFLKTGGFNGSSERGTGAGLGLLVL